MMRVRTFCQDDAHLFVLPEQIEDEISRVIALIDHVYQVLGFEYKVELSTRPEDSMGSEELWNQAEQSLQNVLDKLGIAYHVNEGDGAFYGPKIDFHILDALKGAGSVEPSNWISRCPRNSIFLTSERTTRSIGQSLYIVLFMDLLSDSSAC